MNSLDMIMYTALTVGTLYAGWIIINLMWFGFLNLYHHISDEIAYRRSANKILKYYRRNKYH